MKNSRSFLQYTGSQQREKQLQCTKGMLSQAKRLVAPFVGSGSVFLNTNYRAYLLADRNRDLINLFQMLVTHRQEFIERARQYFVPVTNTKEVYAFYWDVFCNMQVNTAISESKLKRACLFLYLHHHRQVYGNMNNKHKVQGNTGRTTYFPESEMQAFIDKSKRCKVEFLVANFKESLSLVKQGDVVYCELPDLKVTTSKLSWQLSGGFHWYSQVELLNICKELHFKQGVPVVFSNYTKEVEALLEEDEQFYNRFKVIKNIELKLKAHQFR